MLNPFQQTYSWWSHPCFLIGTHCPLAASACVIARPTATSHQNRLLWTFQMFIFKIYFRLIGRCAYRVAWTCKLCDISLNLTSILDFSIGGGQIRILPFGLRVEWRWPCRLIYRYIYSASIQLSDVILSLNRNRAVWSEVTTDQKNWVVAPVCHLVSVDSPTSVSYTGCTPLWLGIAVTQYHHFYATRLWDGRMDSRETERLGAQSWALIIQSQQALKRKMTVRIELWSTNFQESLWSVDSRTLECLGLPKNRSQLTWCSSFYM
jgi:hypothetical protein